MSQDTNKPLFSRGNRVASSIGLTTLYIPEPKRDFAGLPSVDRPRMFLATTSSPPVTTSLHDGALESWAVAIGRARSLLEGMIAYNNTRICNTVASRTTTPLEQQSGDSRMKPLETILEEDEDGLMSFILTGRMILSGHRDITPQPSLCRSRRGKAPLPEASAWFKQIPDIVDEEIRPDHLPDSIRIIQRGAECGNVAGQILLQAAQDLGSTGRLYALVNGLYSRIYGPDESMQYLRTRFDAYRFGWRPALQDIVQELQV